MLDNEIVQKENTVNNGNLIGRDYNDNRVFINIPDAPTREVAVKIKTRKIEIDIEKARDNTVLLKKLENGEFNILSKKEAMRQKINALDIILDLSKSEVGRTIVTKLYEKLVTLIHLKYIAEMEPGEKLKKSMREIYTDFKGIIKEFETIIDVDESFILGLLYIATSNCAIEWKVEQENEC